MNEGDAALAQGFSLLAQSASSVAPRTDRLFVAMLVLCGGMALALFALVLWFSVRYREGSTADRSRPPSHAGGLEAAWTAIPFVVFLGIFGWAAYEAVLAQRAPADALPVAVVAKQWMWKLQHANGRQEINELHVPLGQPVLLVMASQDVIHSFFVPAFRLKQDVLPGRYTRLWFTATQLGDFRLLCTEFCGSDHSSMLGRIVVMAPRDYAHWLESAPRDATLAQQGEAIYRRLACASCHAAASSVAAPRLEGLFGREVALQDGRRATADENYLRRSVLDPRRDVAAGFAPIMPSYAGQLNEDELQALVAYLRSLSSAKEPPR